jgi:hypothetical protein
LIFELCGEGGVAFETGAPEERHLGFTNQHLVLRALSNQLKKRHIPTEQNKMCN